MELMFGEDRFGLDSGIPQELGDQGKMVKPAAVDPEDIEMLEDLIAAAVNSAVAAVDKESEEEMAKMTGGLNIPGLG